jgi:hypothetical protein
MCGRLAGSALRQAQGDTLGFCHGEALEPGKNTTSRGCSKKKDPKALFKLFYK